MPQTPAAINLVCTRCTDGNHAALQRWYNDHVQLLMASPQLQSAELFRLSETTASTDYFCLYHFDQRSDFPAFDSGAVMSDVRERSNAAPGRSSIEIVKRTQYERILHRRWLPEAGRGRAQASLLQIPSHATAETMRWLNDALYRLYLGCSLQSAQVYASAQGEHTELLVLIESEQHVSADWLASSSPYAESTHLQRLWQAQAERIARWLR